MDFSYKEKGLIASLGVTLLVFGWYFYGSFTNLKLSPEPPGFVEIIILIVLIAVLESIIQVFVSFKNKSQLADERDKLIEKISYRYSYWVLSACIWFFMVHILLNTWFDHLPILTTPGGVFHLLLLFFVLAEVTHFLTQLYYYRKGF
jgi:hypothetical protein|tara:strand:- start:74 stop:514 length:441 start_codon:yes stop_codon:yes gene_type:complete